MFGEVTRGMSVVETIGKTAATDKNDKPGMEITITEAGELGGAEHAKITESGGGHNLAMGLVVSLILGVWMFK